MLSLWLYLHNRNVLFGLHFRFQSVSTAKTDCNKNLFKCKTGNDEQGQKAFI